MDRRLRAAVAAFAINTSPADFAPIEPLQTMRFEDETWDLFGDVISGEAGN